MRLVAVIVTGIEMDDYVVQNTIATNEKLYYLQDNINSVIALADTVGSIKNIGSYEAFGSEIYSSIGEKSRFGFAGREKDDNGVFMYYRLRWYDSFTNRFTTEDPLGFWGLDINFYRYVNNNPIYFSDPTGLQYNFNPLPANPYAAAAGGMYRVGQATVGMQNLYSSVSDAYYTYYNAPARALDATMNQRSINNAASTWASKQR
ncbi:MAG: RHS repeat-associated core domain-containing protein [Chitinivibrionales bacterium]|nr:RHS repeat-associated core domain-containing protein [Chitinivibrionales bacterium]